MFDHTQRKLNQGQEAAAAGFMEFLMDPNQKELIITGPGGVGKSHLLGHMVDTVIPRYHELCQMLDIPADYQQIVMTATTNQAAEVLAQSTGREVKTIHSYLNLKIENDYSTGETRLGRSTAWTMKRNTIIVIDEAFTIDRRLLEEIRGSTMNCKIIYVGDHAQMAPVKETVSPLVNQQIKTYELLEPMRTDVPELQALNQQLRKTVETGIFKPIQIVPGIIDWLYGDEMINAVNTHFLDPHTTCKFLAWQNSTVTEYNDYIRSIRGLPPDYTVGEVLVNNSSVELSDGTIPVQKEVEIARLDGHTTMIDVKDMGLCELEVRYADLRLGPNRVVTDMPLPVDRDHYASLIKWAAKAKKWPIYFWLKGKVPDLRPRDAGTVHKIQGSSMDVVFIDLTDISLCTVADTVARLLYVGASRARKRVVFYGKLPEKFGGLIV